MPHLLTLIAVVIVPTIVGAEQAEMFLRSYCYDCHDDSSESGGLSFEAITGLLEDRNVRRA